jgi:prepilin peptidase CpaA
MSNDLTATHPNPTPAPPADDLGIDREFILQMARIPFISIGFVALAWLSDLLWTQCVGPITIPDALKATPTPTNLGPLVVVSLGMIVAAVIDGWIFKVPNWLTLSLVLSGWIIGLSKTLGYPICAGEGGILDALLGTFVGFVLLFPLLPLRGMGEGDVKMQMGFGSWVCAFYGSQGLLGPWVVLAAFCTGVLVGGVMGLIMMACRGIFYKSWLNTVEIFRDVQTLVTAGPAAAEKRALQRHPTRVRLPYGVPLCIGFVGYLLYLYLLG